MGIEVSLNNIFLLVSGLFIVGGFIFRRIQRGPSRTYNVDLTGQVVVITGCSAGIGKESARELAKRNANVVFACRDEKKTMNIINQIKQETGNQNLFFIQLDLQDQDSIKQFSVSFHKKFQKLNILINNAGVAFTNAYKIKDGHDLNFKTNHLGHFLLTNLLMDLIISTKQCRVINVSSEAHTFVKNTVNFEEAYTGKINQLLLSYGVSKYANVLFTNQLQKVFDKKGIAAKTVSLHPGFVSTDLINSSLPNKLYRTLLYPVTKIFFYLSLNEVEGAWTTNFTALQPFEQLQPAGYYQKNSLSQYSKQVTQFNQAQELWDFSEKVLGIKWNI